jgi:predicted dehydrogenase
LAKARVDLSLPETALFKDAGEAIRKSGANVAIVNTPSELHFEQCKAALDAGLHVLVAKPVTNNYEDAAHLARLAADKGLTISVGQQIRYNRHYSALKRFFESGQLGSLEAAWFMNSKPRPNPANLATMAQPSLYENACHHFDSFLAVFGDPTPEWIFCDGFLPSWSPYAGPCMVNALIQFSNNTANGNTANSRPASGSLHLSYHGGFSSRAPMYEFRIEGSQGALRCRGIHMSNDTMSYELAPVLGQFAPAVIDQDIPARDPFLPFFDVWYDYLNGGAEPPFSGRNNLKVFAMLSAAIDSINTHCPVEIASNPRYRQAFETFERSNVPTFQRSNVQPR